MPANKPFSRRHNKMATSTPKIMIKAELSAQRSPGKKNRWEEKKKSVK
jgi:hypothetical protein